MSPPLQKLTLELGRFIAGADACAVAWSRRQRPLLEGAAGACAQVFGSSEKELLGRPAGELFVGGERAARDLAELAPASMTRLLLRVGGPEAGKQFPARLELRRAPAGTVAMVIDLSASRADADAAQRAADLARFASLLAHEVRNPLSAVKIALQTLERHGRLQPNDLRRAEIAIREVGNIELLLSEVLEFARPPTLARVPLDPRGPVRDVAEQLASEWAGRGVQVRCALPERMAPVQADPTRLGTATRLLLRLGALAAEEVGGGEVLLSLRDLPRSTRRAQRLWELSVRDPGRPLSSEAREHAFVPFHPSRARGSGLALAVVERIAREHGGAVKLSSAASGGNLVSMSMADE